ncbi:hypothetical protein C2E23DRAFT_727741, partial [Lenzites betulinus]
AVQNDVRFLMGVREKAYSTRGGRKRAYILPEPLEPGASPRTSGDGTRLFNPDWSLDVDKGVNGELVDAAVALVLHKADAHKIPPALTTDPELIRTAAVTYIQGLKRQYLSEHDEEAARKRQKKLGVDKHHARRHRKADWLRIGIEAFRKAFGDDNTSGVEDLIHTPWQSDEYSSDGEADHEDRELQRHAAQAGESALEVRSLLWRSQKLVTLYIVLSVFARFQRDHKDVAHIDPAVDQNGGEISDPEVLDAARKAYLAEVIKAAKEWRTIYANGWQHHGRFRGPAANSRNEPRPDKKHTIFQQCFSRKWAKQSPEHARLYAKALEAPPAFTVLDLEIPEDLVPKDDLVWLNSWMEADSEESETESLDGDSE